MWLSKALAHDARATLQPSRILSGSSGALARQAINHCNDVGANVLHDLPATVAGRALLFSLVAVQVENRFVVRVAVMSVHVRKVSLKAFD